MTLIPDTDQLTAQSWMLFSDLDGVNQAARELTYALEMALTCDNRELLALVQIRAFSLARTRISRKRRLAWAPGLAPGHLNDSSRVPRMTVPDPKLK
jgi:hypothetical protein